VVVVVVTLALVLRVVLQAVVVLVHSKALVQMAHLTLAVAAVAAARLGRMTVVTAVRA
jgi:hypothetical protein